MIRGILRIAILAISYSIVIYFFPFSSTFMVLRTISGSIGTGAEEQITTKPGLLKGVAIWLSSYESGQDYGPGGVFTLYDVGQNDNEVAMLWGAQIFEYRYDAPGTDSTPGAPNASIMFTEPVQVRQGIRVKNSTTLGTVTINYVLYIV